MTTISRRVVSTGMLDAQLNRAVQEVCTDFRGLVDQLNQKCSSRPKSTSFFDSHAVKHEIRISPYLMSRLSGLGIERVEDRFRRALLAACDKRRVRATVWVSLEAPKISVLAGKMKIHYRPAD